MQDIWGRLGGLDELPEADLALVRAAAGLTVESERLQCLIVEGKGVNHDAIVRLEQRDASCSRAP